MRIVVSIAAFVLCAPAAFASARLPIPGSSRVFATNAACVRSLAALMDIDRRKAAPRRMRPDGTIQYVTVEAGGIERDVDGVAWARSIVWYHHGRYQRNVRMTEFSHTFERRLRQCRGRVMHETGENGFTLSTFEPARRRQPR